MREFRIEAGACRGQRLQNRRGFEGAVHQHAAGGVGGLAAGFAALDNQNSGSAFSQGNSQREADDAATDDDYVPSLHIGIVKEPRDRGAPANVGDRERGAA
jgi:hypothetical protein